MSVREALMAGGVVSLVVSALLFVLAARTYVVEDIRGVRDDLEGRRRRERLVPVMARVGEGTWSASGDRTVVGLERDEGETLVAGGASSRYFVVTAELLLCDGAGEMTR